ncbi:MULTISPECIES: TetR/AcrR family transcriptional regulator [Pseudoalteromonas]|jgi:TetR/AcrR family transcriptional repressor of uid operon|uniref:Helix-turn-helix domain-containing protein n=2 Tax=Pseudoalteromonas TaxID=53246 RepID=F3BH99_9GAMM|nr:MULTISPECIES: TetR/AcrR family transcriptional regulator [Pseudoalteromonas]EGI74064.1 putative transcriptional regulator [Pseudoalteromonas distincta]KAA1153055.1 TetR/AcrR family transcriptional regulator [Pseudoalteromonas distincta]KHM49190.1 TetR family transcriptional regulator [Pseudoalteromonas elyakovii]KID37898.1 TetR family transcriptional regulator [Pseudoalteromonas distincta]MBB1278126.1 TetR/AcrR family transcriptional regulator [Pseudoalteromonas sp. SR43-3]|tara:strand:+ start:51625 stop:52251 length:627 start_codon:yes stop_codon:yes gene_type:complete
MKPKAKRQTDPAIALARREQILTAAAECFRRKGYHGAGMAEISKTAGMSAGHIYNYFESKEAIIESIIEKDMEEMFSIFQKFEDHPGDVLAALLDGLNIGVQRHMDTGSCVIDLDMMAEAGRNIKVATLLRETDIQARGRMRQLLTSERSALKDIDERELESRINVIFSMMAGLLLRKLLYPELTEETVLIALRPAMKTLLMPFDKAQ